MDDDGWLILILGALGLLALASYLTNKPSATTASTPAPAKVLQPVISNEEVWEWTDYAGRHRQIEIHRTVKTDGSA